MKKVAVALAASVLVLGAKASPLAIPLKAVSGGVGKIVTKVCGKAAGSVACYGRRALERATAARNAACAGGDVMKHVTPGKILAVGGATALVTGTHEVADGVQTMGEGVKETLRENPQSIGSVVGAVAAPVKIAAAFVCGLVALLLCWFIWPWVVFCRKWSELRAFKKTAAMRVQETAFETSAKKGTTSGCADVIDVPAADCPGFHPGRIDARFLNFLVAAVLVVAVGVFSLSCFDYDSVSNSDISKIKDRNREMQLLSAEYGEAVERGYKRFCEDVEKTAEMEYSAVQATVPSVAARFGMFSRLKDYCISMAKDKLKDCDCLEKRISADLESDYYTRLYSARDSVLLCLERFINDVDLARKAYRVKTESELAGGHFPGDEDYLKTLGACEMRIDEAKAALSSAQKSAAISAALELAFVRQTGAIIAKALGKTVAREVATMGGSAAAALADGPLPIVDAIAVVVTFGCTAWTCYDINKATKILPDRLRGALSEATEECKRGCLNEVLALGEKIKCDALKL